MENEDIEDNLVTSPELSDPMVNKETAFMGNPLLKREREPMNLTKEHIIELKKCIDDPVYFAQNYIKIVNVDKGLMTINLYPYQKRIIKGLHEHRNSIVLSCRQSGKTTVTVCYMLHYILFNKDKKLCILANKLSTAREIVNRIQTAYIHLPKWIQQGVKSWSKTSFSLENRKFYHRCGYLFGFGTSEAHSV